VIFLLVLCGLIGIGLVLVTYGTLNKNKWGINLAAVSCPRCKSSAPQVRTPNSLGQTLWGGWTCPMCRAEVDKWGREIELPCQ
jgi:hypothetical protein